MPLLPLVYAPNPIFRKKAAKVEKVDEEIRRLVAGMFDTLYREQGAGLGANMVGVLKQIIVMDVKKDGKPNPIAMINPTILKRSSTMQTFEEASLSFPGISAEVTRPAEISVEYLDPQGGQQLLDADGFLAAVIQHEMDYLEGRTFLDHLSRVKKDRLLRRYKKLRR
ncbi:peptide deformylase [Sneathiella sp.]|jgi:peptide deformylase|uniref:peptide deformylase n=1 Tax=Sneathiella sp. TaxID=1964365 RepID=UPI0039E50EEC